MNDLEFDILDELYFVQHFEVIQKELEINQEALKSTLQAMWQKGWVKLFHSVEEEIIEQEAVNFETNYQTYYYLATKEGLLAHNSK